MFKRIIALLVAVTFITSYDQNIEAQGFHINQLPIPGSRIDITSAYVPLTLKGMIIHSDDALKFDFLMDSGDTHLEGRKLSGEALKIMKYFLTALTIPEDDLWVNLSPYEKNRIIQNNFGQTIMGQDLLTEDYILKQLTSSLIYPERSLGKEFWSQVYSKSYKDFGTTQIPVNTFNKVWIVPSEAVVWEHDGKVLIVKSRLKVMLEEDYLALNKSLRPTQRNSRIHSVASNIVRQIVLPVLEKEVNEGQNFAQLRQMYQAMILATWYKKSLKESILNKIYADKKKTVGIGGNNNDVELIYQQYLKSFKKGAFNYIKEDFDPALGKAVPRKYFSGGFSLKNPAMLAQGASSFAFSLVVLRGILPASQQEAIALGIKSKGQTLLIRSQILEQTNSLKVNSAMLSFLDLATFLMLPISQIKLEPVISQEILEKFFQKWSSNDITTNSFIMAIPMAVTFYLWKHYTLNGILNSGTFYSSDFSDIALTDLDHYLAKQDFHTLIRLLQHKNPTVREHVKQRLSLFRDPRVTGEFQSMMKDENNYSFAEKALIDSGASNEQMANGYMVALELGGWQSRMNAVKKLGIINVEELSSSLRDRLIKSLLKLSEDEYYSDYLKRALNNLRATDKAMNSGRNLGGISLNARLFDLQIKRDSNGVPLEINQQPLDKINIQGFIPQIISIQFVDLPLILGFEAHTSLAT